MKKNTCRVLSIFLTLALLVGACGLFAFADDAAGDVPFRVTVSMNGDASTQRGFCWYTKSEAGSEVSITDENGEAVEAQVISTDTFEWNGNYMHKVTVGGLEAGKTYNYTVGSGSSRSPEGTFTTDNGDSSLSFITIADVQAGSLENFRKGAATLGAAFETMPGAEFVVNCGDFTNDSTNEEWDYFDEAFSDINRGTTLVPVAGNHDGLGVADWFNNMFNLDTSESVQTKNGVNYSFDYGNAHIAVLNTNDGLSITLAQLKWLKNDLNSTAKDWKIVFMHKTPYTFGKDGKWPDALYLQESLTKVCEDCGVDLVMSGHDHQYLRTKPLVNGKVNDNGVTYVLSGTAGTKRYEIRKFLSPYFMDTDNIAALTIQKDGYGNYWNGTDWDSTNEDYIGGCFNTVSIEGGTLTLKSYILNDATGETVCHDTYTVTKETGKNVATFSGDNTTSEAEYNLGIVPSFLALAAYTFSSWLPRFFAMLPKLIYIYITEDTF